MHTLVESAFRRSRYSGAVNKPDSAKKIIKYRDEFSSLVADYLGDTASVATIHKIAIALCNKLRVVPELDELTGNAQPITAHITYNAVRKTLHNILPLNAKIVHEHAHLAAIRMAGNVPSLLAGIPITPWQLQPYNEWCVGCVRYTKNNTSNRGNIIGIELFSGAPTGLWTDLRVYTNTLDRIYVTAGIVSSRDVNNVYVHPDELVGMFVQLHVDAGAVLQVSDVRCFQTTKQLNKELKQRRSKEKRKCPGKFQWECHECPLAKKDCSLAIRDKRPPVGLCKNGHTGFILAHEDNLCVTCAINSWKMKRGLGPLYRPPKLERTQHDTTEKRTESGRPGNNMGIATA